MGFGDRAAGLGGAGHDYTGITVPDVKAATAFFTDVLGCAHAMSFGPFMDDKGKTTLMRYATGLCRAVSGTVHFDGGLLPQSTSRRAQRGIGYVPQGRHV